MELGLVAAIVAAVFVLLVLWTAARPERATPALFVATVCVPIDLSITAGPFPRLGPTRLLVAAWLLGLLIRIVRRKLQSRTPAFAWPLVVPVGAYVGFECLSSFFSPFPLASVYTIADQMATQVVAFYAMVHLNRENRFTERMEGAVVLAVALVCAFALFEALTASNPMIGLFPGEEITYRAGLPRVRSSFFHPIALGGFLALALPHVLWRFQSSRGAARFGLTSLGVAMAVVSLLTMSRGPWLALVLEGALLATVWPIRGRRLPMRGAASCGAAALVLVSWSWWRGVEGLLNPNQLAIGSLASESSSEYYRVALYQGVTERLSGGRWWVGFGPGTFQRGDVGVRYDRDDHTLTAPDSHLLKVLFETGLLGLGLFVGLQVAVIRYCFRGARRKAATALPGAAIALASCSGFIVSNLTASLFQVYPLALLYWFSASLAASRPSGGWPVSPPTPPTVHT
jgi:O-antigen ligase